MSDGLGKVKPEVYTFARQSRDEVHKLFEQVKKDTEERYKQTAADIRCAVESPKGPPAKLCYEDESSNWGMPNLNEYKKAVDIEDVRHDEFVDDSPEVLGMWRRLAGVTKENVELTKEIPDLAETVLLKCRNRFISGLDVRWEPDGWRRVLTINGARTKIDSTSIVAALEGSGKHNRSRGRYKNCS